jgi:hypothetical protein
MEEIFGMRDLESSRFQEEEGSKVSCCKDSSSCPNPVTSSRMLENRDLLNRAKFVFSLSQLNE